MATIGRDNITGLGSNSRTNSDPHFIQSGINTYTPSGAETLTEVGFHCGTNYGAIEVGVYRTDTLAKIASATVTATAANTRTAASVSGSLSAGVTYAVAWRTIDANVDYQTTYADSAGSRDSTRNGSTALQNTFNDTLEGLTSEWAVFATTTASSAPVLTSGMLLRGIG